MSLFMNKGVNKAINPSDTPPSNLNTIWFDQIENKFKVYDDNLDDWITIGGSDDGVDLSNYYTKDETTELLSERSYKDVVFMLGDELNPGGQPHSEFMFLYSGMLEEMHSSIGLDSANSSNLIFSLQKRVGTSWVNIAVMELQAGEFAKTFALDEPINNERLRINLISGDYDKVASMSIIAHIKI